MVEAQGGDPRVVDDPEGVLPAAPVRRDVLAPRGRWLAGVDAEAVGRTAMALGAGRVHKGDPVDPAVGVELFAKVGEAVGAGALLGRVHARDEVAADMAEARLLETLTWSDELVEAPPLTYAWLGAPATT
jgi:thymidine phosphorylase